MKLIIGLGNPGKNYEKTRHNIGFLVIDERIRYHNFPGFSYQKDHKSYLSQGIIYGRKIFAIKPQTYMNLSGEAVLSVKNFFKIESKNFLVIHDEVDFEFGRNELKFGGSHAGHNGLRNIIDNIKSREFRRLRVGIGRPVNDRKSLADFVLSDFENEELENIKKNMQKLLAMIDEFVRSG